MAVLSIKLVSTLPCIETLTFSYYSKFCRSAITISMEWKRKWRQNESISAFGSRLNNALSYSFSPPAKEWTGKIRINHALPFPFLFTNGTNKYSWAIFQNLLKGTFLFILHLMTATSANKTNIYTDQYL